MRIGARQRQHRRCFGVGAAQAATVFVQWPSSAGIGAYVSTAAPLPLLRF
ncbi:hypothetical protein GLA29479_5065 [Lysobacter antibioticus]|nr:hypothetical protein GLA29479_5065 [Lysobacter antibioticus]